MHNAYKNWIINSYNQIQTEYVELNKLDQIVGDGDQMPALLALIDNLKQPFYEISPPHTHRIYIKF